MSPYLSPERYVGIVVRDGDEPKKVRSPEEIPNKDIALHYGKLWRPEIFDLIQKLKLWRQSFPPPAVALELSLNRLDGFLSALEFGTRSRKELLDLLPLELDFRNIFQVIFDTGTCPVASVFDVPEWYERKREKDAAEAHAIQLEANIARKAKRDAEKARFEQQELKRKQLAADLGLDLGPLPRGAR